MAFVSEFLVENPFVKLGNSKASGANSISIASFVVQVFHYFLAPILILGSTSVRQVNDQGCAKPMIV